MDNYFSGNKNNYDRFDTKSIASINSLYYNKNELDHQDFCSASSIRDFVTVLALSFHAVFEGLAVGLEPDNADVWQLFGGD